MSKQVCVYRPHSGKRRDAARSRMMIDEAEFNADLAEAKKEGREPFYTLCDIEDAPSFDQLPKAEQKAELDRQEARKKLNELADAEAAA